MASNKWVADFETTTNAEDCRVWLWGVVSVDDPTKFEHGIDIESFLEWCKKNNNPKVYFHNLRFDAQFLIYYLLTNNFKWTEGRSSKDNTFSTLITSTGEFYSARVVFSSSGHHIHKVEFYDSMKLIGSMSVSSIAKSYNMTISKGEIDFHKNRPIGYKPSIQELVYVNRDCQIIAVALKSLQDLGVKGITIGQAAMKNYKEGKKRFKSYFPTMPKEIEEDIRQAYKGGFTYLNPIYKDKEIGAGFFLDKNSMYPSILMTKAMPFGRPAFFEGKFEPSLCYPIAIQKISVSADIKEGKTPFLRSKNTPDYSPLDYITSTNGDLITFTLTSPEIELLFENYEVHEIIYHSGWKFSARMGMFNDYIEYWSHEKEQAKENGDRAKYIASKLFLNSLIGKFGARSVGRQKKPFLNKEGIVEYKSLGKETRKSVYSPVALFVTAYARCELARTIEKIRDFGFKKYGKDVYVYSDTDSIVTTLPIESLSELDSDLDLDDSRMGAWKLEKVFSNAKFLHAKCYMTIDHCGISHATIASMPRALAAKMKFENFTEGFSTNDMKSDPEFEKLMSKQQINVKGGTILETMSFTIQKK